MRCMSPRHLRLYIVASATSLTLLAIIVAGTSSSPGLQVLALDGLLPPSIKPLSLGGPAVALARTGRRS
mgnify:CR=1 FL=1